MIENNEIQAERIYIGGLDPDQLSVAQVLERLKEIKDVCIVSAEDCSQKTNHPGTFFFVSAKSLDTSKSALQILVSRYNNVKWRGCRIKVESSKPHILERYAAERAERQKKLETPQVVILINQDPVPEPEPKPCKLPRELRIRKKPGDEVTPVDTKPKRSIITLTSRGLLEDRMEQRSKKRGYHLVFVDPDENTNLASVSGSDSDSEQSSQVSISSKVKACSTKVSEYLWSDDDDSRSSQSSKNANLTGATKTTKIGFLRNTTEPILIQRYDPTSAAAKQFEVAQNSNDKSHVDSIAVSGESKNCNNEFSNQQNHDDNHLTIAEDNGSSPQSADVTEDGSSHENELLVEREGTNIKETNKDTGSDLDQDVQRNLSILVSLFPESKTDKNESESKPKTAEGYDSNDDSDDHLDLDSSSSAEPSPDEEVSIDSDESETGEKVDNLSFDVARRLETQDGVAMSKIVNNRSDEEDEDLSVSSKKFDHPEVPTEIDLEQDVSKNLGILASLFPDWNTTQKAAAVVSQDKKVKTLGKIPFSNVTMPRYDPTNTATKQYELSAREPEPTGMSGHAPVDEVPTENVNNEDSKQTDDEKYKSNTNEMEDGTHETNQIYEEKTLEGIFKDQTLRSKSASIFGFFDDIEQGQHEDNPEGFSFGFKDKDNEEERANQQEESEEQQEPQEFTFEDPFKDESANKVRTPAFILQQELLDDLENKYFALNGGIKTILEHTQEEFQEWLDDKRAIREDWKKKRRLAKRKRRSK